LLVYFLISLTKQEYILAWLFFKILRSTRRSFFTPLQRNSNPQKIDIPFNPLSPFYKAMLLNHNNHRALVECRLAVLVLLVLYLYASSLIFQGVRREDLSEKKIWSLLFLMESLPGCLKLGANQGSRSSFLRLKSGNFASLQGGFS
jgi:hypothetical protein